MTGVANTHSDTILLSLSDYEKKHLSCFKQFSVASIKTHISIHWEFLSSRMRRCVTAQLNLVTRRHTTEVRKPQPHRCENLKTRHFYALFTGCFDNRMISRRQQIPCIPWILKPCTRCSWMVSLKPRSRRSVDGSQCAHWTWAWVGPKACLDALFPL